MSGDGDSKRNNDMLAMKEEVYAELDWLAAQPVPDLKPPPWFVPLTLETPKVEINPARKKRKNEVTWWERLSGREAMTKWIDEQLTEFYDGFGPAEELKLQKANTRESIDKFLDLIYPFEDVLGRLERGVGHGLDQLRAALFIREITKPKTDGRGNPRSTKLDDDELLALATYDYYFIMQLWRRVYRKAVQAEAIKIACARRWKIYQAAQHAQPAEKRKPLPKYLQQADDEDELLRMLGVQVHKQLDKDDSENYGKIHTPRRERSKKGSAA